MFNVPTSLFEKRMRSVRIFSYRRWFRNGSERISVDGRSGLQGVLGCAAGVLRRHFDIRLLCADCSPLFGCVSSSVECKYSTNYTNLRARCFPL